MITDDDIRRAVAPNAFHAGQAYHRDGRVMSLRVSADGTAVVAGVRGSHRSPYHLSIELIHRRNGALTIEGSCTCPVGFNCKHVAAVLFEYRQRAPATIASQVRSPSIPSGSLSGPVNARTASNPAGLQKTIDAPLPYEVDAWLRSLDAAQEEESEDYPPTVRKRLLYVLDRGPHSSGLIVDVRSIDLKRDGSPGSASRRHPTEQLLRAGQQPKYLRPSDRTILSKLANSGAERGEEFIVTLRTMIATGRARWAAWDGPILTEGRPVSGELTWVVADDGRQRPYLAVPQQLVPLRLSEPWYVDPATGVMGPVETALPARLVRAMLDSPALAPAVADRVREEMGRRWPGGPLPTPKPIAAPQILRERLQPHLLLLAGDLPFDPTIVLSASHYRRPPAPRPHRVPLARLSWVYGPISIPSSQHRHADSAVQHGGVLFQIVRDAKAEDRAAERMRHLGIAPINHHYSLPQTHPHANDLLLTDPDPGAWIEFMLGDVPQLRADGWLIDVADDFPLRLVEPEGGISFEIKERSGIDWFDLDLGVMVNGTRVNLVPALLDFIAHSGTTSSAHAEDTFDEDPLPLLLPLPDGRLIAVPPAQLRPILAPLLELFTGAEVDEAAGLLRLSRRNAGDLALLEAAGIKSGITWTGGDSIRSLGRQLREHGGIPPCPVPPSFQARLRGYQEQGLAWLQFLRTAGLGGVLADDMGLGKTVQALAHLAIEQAEGRLDRPALLICPTSLVPNWQSEAARFAPSLHTLILHGADRSDRFESIGRHDLVITTYPLLGRDHAVLTAQEWHVVILDEAQTIKNPLATTSKLARTLRARQRLCLSGTPLENHLGELWSLFDFLMPGFLGNSKQFGRRYRGPIEKGGNSERQKILAQRITPFLLRRTKEQVAADLPPKTEITETVEMGDGQRAIYEGIRLAMHAKVRAAIAKRGLAGSGIIILDALLKLRQACCDPRLLKLETAKAAKARSAKLERLLEMLPQMLEEGRRVLLFSQFTSMLALIESELTELALPYVLLTGDTKDRTVPIRRFQAGEVNLFLISLKAGGVGLNLTAADTVIHYDPWWNPAVEDQATDRAHRIGQDKPVFVHRLSTVGTIEEKIEVLKQRKQALAAGILEGTAGASLKLTERDLELLFT